jgi:protein-disulfide isomerase
LLDTAKLLNQQAIVEKQEASVSLVNAVQEELLKPTPGIIGNPDGKQVVAEFFDYQCIHCRDAAPELLALAAKDHDLKIVLREVPVLGQGSEIAAFAALAAAKQGLYMKMHDALMVAPVPISLEVVDAAAKGIGADVAKLHADMASKDVAAQIEENLSLARRVGMTGTPAFAAPGAGEMDGWSDIHAFESFMAHKSRT